jgi:hypothetical protein
MSLSMLGAGKKRRSKKAAGSSKKAAKKSSKRKSSKKKMQYGSGAPAEIPGVVEGDCGSFVGGGTPALKKKRAGSKKRAV